MQPDHLIVKTKLIPPRPPKRTLNRPRIRNRIALAKDYRLTLVQAGAGYGKSTALAELAHDTVPLVWYHLHTEDSDPFTFFNHLLYGFHQTFPDFPEAASALLENWDGQVAWKMVADVFINTLTDIRAEAVFLVLDDAHTLTRSAEMLELFHYLLRRVPPTLHIILSTRTPFPFPMYSEWKLTDQILEIGQQELAFTPAEISALFNRWHDFSLAKDDITALAKETQGWAIALQMVRQRLQANPALAITEMLAQLSAPNQDIFAYLAQHVLQQQSPAIQEFLLATAVLQQMTARQCDCLRAANDSASLLKRLAEDGLFVADLGNGTLRYHPLFHNFLKHRLAPATAQALHRRAAACYQQQRDDGGAIYHLLRAEAFDEAAAILDRFGREMVWSARFDTLMQWLALIPENVLAEHPSLLIYRGDVARLHSQFESALKWYRRAETLSRQRNDIQVLGRALRGQARVYLDTVNPAPAEKLLEEALQLIDVEEDQGSRTRLLNLLAENMLNLGQLSEAERFRKQAETLQPEMPRAIELTARVLLRTGRLHEAHRRLREQLAAEEKNPVLRPRGHREPLLLLALVSALLGNRDDALKYAKLGTARGNKLNAPFSTSVGYARQAHAHILEKTPESYRQAILLYEKALAIGETLMVPRLKPELFWGMVQAYGFQGDLETAESVAQQGIDILQKAGDEWVESFIKLTMGAAYVLNGKFDTALVWLNQAGNSFKECSEPFGECLVHLWRALLWYRQHDSDRLTRAIDQCLQLARQHRYDFLFTRKTFLGPPTPRMVIPILLHAKQHTDHRLYIRQLLKSAGLEQVELHPGYQLRVQTLGQFTVSLGSQELSPQAWQRKTARRLFQLFITHNHQLLNRDKILEALWHDSPPDKARRDFKVALSTLTRALEPHKAQRAPSAFIIRDGEAYGLRPYADIWLDTDEFINHIERGDEVYSTLPDESLTHYRQALALYHNDYLPDAIYEDWSSEKREQLLALFLRTAERVARIQANRGDWEAVIPTCEMILARDDCWEEAYRLMMTAYSKLGNRPQVLRTFRQCTEKLDSSLGIAPSPETTELFRALSA